MKTYCFKCKTCRHHWAGLGPEVTYCPRCKDGSVVRDYRAEAVGIGSGVRASREGGHRVRSAGQPGGDAGSTPAPSTT